MDHLVVDYIFVKDQTNDRKVKKTFSKKEKDRRIKITLKNAREFLNIHKKRELSFIPIGVAQGYDINTYKKSFRTLIKMGYKYIGIGGLVQYNSEFVLDLLKALQPVPDDVKIHLFGILRPRYLSQFQELGVTSFDSASFFRKAWLRSGQNYLSSSGKWYAAIRIPNSTDPRILKNAEPNGYSISDIKKMEKKSLDALIKYNKGEITAQKALKIVLKYDNLLIRNTNDGDNLEKRYMHTLVDMPWKSCNCEVCKNIGVHAVIFRGCNRNKRRGFHNTWTFKDRLMKKNE